MFEVVEEPVARLLKVPSQPDPPAGAPESIRVFRASPAFFKYRLLGWGFGQVSAFAGLVFGFFILGVFPDDWAWAKSVELLGVAFFFLQLPFTFFLIFLDYRYRWYVVTDRSLRIREGIWKVQERTMTFSNLQHLSVRQGPVQRLFGIADLEARTAGGGGSSQPGPEHKNQGDNMHLGYFRGVDNADEIRETLMAHMRKARAAGLGDPDEPAHPPEPADVEAPAPPAASSQVVDAAREILDEARALRTGVRLATGG